MKNYTKQDIDDLFAQMFGLTVKTSKPENIIKEDKSNSTRFEKGNNMNNIIQELMELLENILLREELTEGNKQRAEVLIRNIQLLRNGE